METKKCINCKEDIYLDAKKCKHCDSFQDSLKYKNELAYIIILLTIVISVITFYNQLNEIIKNMNHEKISKLEFDVIDTYDDHLKILIRNEGNIPAVIKSASISNYLKNGPLTNCRIPLDNPILVKPNEYIIQKIYPYCAIPRSIKETNKFLLSDLKKIPKKALCKIILDVMQQGNIQQYKSLEFKCVLNQDMTELFEVMEANKSQK